MFSIDPRIQAVGAVAMAALLAGCGSTDVSAAAGATPEAPQSTEGWTTTLIADGFERPWGMAFLPDGDLLITEKGGDLFLLDPDSGDRSVVGGVPDVFAGGQGGLMEVSLHPEFESNGTVYLALSAGDQSANRTELWKASFDGSNLSGVEMIWSNSRYKNGGQHFGARIVWLEDGTLLLAIGDGGNPPVELDGEHVRNKSQDVNFDFGKVIRLNDDGSFPADNPFVDQGDSAADVYSYGHRNIQGMVLDPETGRIWANEHGAKGGDELNLVTSGTNYGWPLATHSVEYWDVPISENTSLPGMEDPVTYWTPSPAPSGLAIYHGDVFPDWEGDLFSGNLRAQNVKHIDLDADGNVVAEVDMPIGARVRDVRLGPDGHLYILTDEGNGRLLRIDPA